MVELIKINNKYKTKQKHCIKRLGPFSYVFQCVFNFYIVECRIQPIATGKC